LWKEEKFPHPPKGKEKRKKKEGQEQSVVEKKRTEPEGTDTPQRGILGKRGSTPEEKKGKGRELGALHQKEKRRRISIQKRESQQTESNTIVQPVGEQRRGPNSSQRRKSHLLEKSEKKRFPQRGS